MKKVLVIIAAIIVGVVALVAWYQVVPSRLTAAQQRELVEAQRALDAVDAEETVLNEEETEAVEAPVEAAPVVAKEETKPVAEYLKQESVRVKLATSKGDVVVELYPGWAPIGVERFLDLVQQDFFDKVKFFRVVTQPRPFVVQFGIAADPAVSAKWRDRTLAPDPVKQSNLAGTLTYAQGGTPDTRTTQLFINLGDNAFLDGMGFAPIGKVVEGMDVVRAFNSQYQDVPTRAQGQIQMAGNAFLDEQFPGLDFIESAEIVEAPEAEAEAPEAEGEADAE